MKNFYNGQSQKLHFFGKKSNNSVPRSNNTRMKSDQFSYSMCFIGKSERCKSESRTKFNQFESESTEVWQRLGSNFCYGDEYMVKIKFIKA